MIEKPVYETHAAGIIIPVDRLTEHGTLGLIPNDESQESDAREYRLGNGRCTMCSSCQGYTGGWTMCQNCGHPFDRHL